MASYTKTNWQNGITPINDTNLNKIEDALEEVFGMIYPVGSIYMSVNNTSPATLFGGTWEQIEDRFLLAAGSTYTNGSTGGQATHNHGLTNAYAKIGLQGDRLTQHNSSTSISEGVTGKTVVLGGIQDITNWSMYNTSGLGGNTDNANNMPPYLAVYVWKRTA